MFTLPNFLTAGNLLCGIMSIMVSLNGRLDLGVLFLIIAMILDFLDGFVARMLNQQAEIGKQLDSLADMVSFGVAPGVLVFVMFIVSSAVQISGSLAQTLVYPTMGSSMSNLIDLYFDNLLVDQEAGGQVFFQGWSILLPFVSLFIPFFSMFRLAKFNLDTRQSDQFIGLPTPANAMFFMGITLTLWYGFGSDGIGAVLAEVLIREQVLMTLVVVFSAMLIAELPLISLKFKTFDFQKNWDRYTLLISGLLLIILLQYFALSFIVLLYLLLSILRFFISKSNSNEIQS